MSQLKSELSITHQAPGGAAGITLHKTSVCSGKEDVVTHRSKSKRLRFQLFEPNWDSDHDLQSESPGLSSLPQAIPHFQNHSVLNCNRESLI